MKESISSKKFLFSIGSVVVALAYAVIAAIWLPAMSPMYETFTGSLEFVVGAYVLGNVGNKWVLGKATVTAPKKKAEESDPLDRDVPSK